MTEANQVLSQEDIDGLITKNVSKKPHIPHAQIVMEAEPTPVKQTISVSTTDDTINLKKQNASPPPKTIKDNNTASSHHEECIAAGEINSLGQQILDLSSRIARMEAALIKLEGKNSSNEIPAAQIKAAVQQMKNVSTQVELITEGLRGTAGYNLSKTFKCNSCKTTGVVAVKVKCTQCGQENWWGWWPKKK